MLKTYVTFMFSMLKLNKREILVLLICPILSAALSVFFAYASKNIIDMVFINRDMPYLFFMIPLLIGVYILYFLIEILDVFLVVRWKIKIDFDTKCAYFDRINKIQYEYIEGISSAKLFHRMFSDGSSISGYLFTLCITIPLDIAFSAIFLIIMILWSPQLTIYVMLLIVVQGINLIIFRKPIENINRLQRETDQKVANYVLEKLNLLSFAGIVDIGKWWTRNVEKEFAEARRISIKNSFRLTVFKQLISLVQQFWSLGLLFIGALLIVGNHMSIGVFFGFQTLVNYIISPFSSLVSSVLLYQDNKVAFKRFLEYYDLPVQNGDGVEFKFEKTIVFEDVRYRYVDSNSNAINIFSSVFHHNEIIVFSGESGSGKTTLMKLMARLLNLQDGSIKIDGVDIRDINYKDYLRNVGFMSQEPIIFTDTLINNLLLDNEVSDGELKSIITKCHLQDIIDNLPEGLATVIGKNEIELSVGEAQRISLARILLKKPKILWLDEPTSALDKATEQIVIDTIIQYSKRKQTLVIINSHNSVVHNIADKVFGAL